MQRRLEQIDQLRNASDQVLQLAEWYDRRRAKRLAGRHRDIAVAMNRLRYELIQLEEKKHRSLEALQMARMTIDGEVSS